MPRSRLDLLLVKRGLAESRAKAQALLMAGVVRVAGQVQTKPGTMVHDHSDIAVDQPLPYVSRGGYKLAHALDAFALNPNGLVALDIGASTGGFTDVFLQRGAKRVYAVDVGYGLLDWRLRQDSRVVVLERTNIRYLNNIPLLEQDRHDEHDPLSTCIQCASIDVSFISLHLVLPVVVSLIHPSAWIVVLIKPQFEAGPKQVGKGGVVRDSSVHAHVLRNIFSLASTLELTPCGLTCSPITGPAGNVEFLMWLQKEGISIDRDQSIDTTLDEAKTKQ